MSIGGYAHMEAVTQWPRAEPAPARRWFVLVTLSGLERVAKMHLDEAKIETFLPLVETDRKRQPRGKAPDLPYITVPRFPGYLFVHLLAADPLWYSVREARGVLHALTSEGGRPIPVPTKDIDRWLDRADKDGIVEHWVPPKERRKRFDYGALVRVIGGPFTSYVGVVESQRGEKIVVIMPGKRVELRWDQIEPAW